MVVLYHIISYEKTVIHSKRNTTYYQIVNNMTEYSMIYSIIIQYDIFRYFIMFHCIVLPCIAMKTYHYIVA